MGKLRYMTFHEEKLSSIWENKDFSDVTINVIEDDELTAPEPMVWDWKEWMPKPKYSKHENKEDKSLKSYSIKAHWFLLRIHSEYFNALFKFHPYKDTLNIRVRPGIGKYVKLVIHTLYDTDTVYLLDEYKDVLKYAEIADMLGFVEPIKLIMKKFYRNNERYVDEDDSIMDKDIDLVCLLDFMYDIRILDKMCCTFLMRTLVLKAKTMIFYRIILHVLTILKKGFNDPTELEQLNVQQIREIIEFSKIDTPDDSISSMFNNCFGSGYRITTDIALLCRYLKVIDYKLDLLKSLKKDGRKICKRDYMDNTAILLRKASKFATIMITDIFRPLESKSHMYKDFFALDFNAILHLSEESVCDIGQSWIKFIHEWFSHNNEQCTIKNIELILTAVKKDVYSSEYIEILRNDQMFSIWKGYPACWSEICCEFSSRDRCGNYSDRSERFKNYGDGYSILPTFLKLQRINRRTRTGTITRNSVFQLPEDKLYVYNGYSIKPRVTIENICQYTKKTMSKIELYCESKDFTISTDLCVLYSICRPTATFNTMKYLIRNHKYSRFTVQNSNNKKELHRMYDFDATELDEIGLAIFIYEPKKDLICDEDYLTCWCTTCRAQYYLGKFTNEDSDSDSDY